MPPAEDTPVEVQEGESKLFCNASVSRCPRGVILSNGRINHVTNSPRENLKLFGSHVDCWSSCLCDVYRQRPTGIKFPAYHPPTTVFKLRNLGFIPLVYRKIVKNRGILEGVRHFLNKTTGRIREVNRPHSLLSAIRNKSQWSSFKAPLQKRDSSAVLPKVQKSLKSKLKILKLIGCYPVELSLLFLPHSTIILLKILRANEKKMLL